MADVKLLEWLPFLECILSALLFFAGYFLHTDRNLHRNAARLIDEAEALFLGQHGKGDEKIDWVLERLHQMIPKPFQRIITISLLRIVVQNTFDAMQHYASLQGAAPPEDAPPPAAPTE